MGKHRGALNGYLRFSGLQSDEDRETGYYIYAEGCIR